MSKLNIVRCCFVLLFCAVSPAQGGGSLIPEEIEAVVAQKAELWAVLNAGFELERGGVAGRIGSNQNEALAGTRLLPFLIRAKPKGAEGPYVYAIELQGTNTYFDQRGRKSALKSAKSVKLTFTGINLRKLKPDEMRE